MKLTDWLSETETSKTDLAVRLGVTPEAVRFWCIGRSIPRRETLQAIAAATDGKVTASDFYAQEAA